MPALSTVCRRLAPGEDLKEALTQIVSDCGIQAAAVISLVGSLTVARLRMAGAGEASQVAGPLEIVSATGTICPDGLHVHLSVSDSSGTTCGGHLMPGSLVYTTVEVVILDLTGQWVFRRVHDEATGYPELRPEAAPGAP